MQCRVVITGLGVVTSLSCQVEDLWKRVLAGESGIHELRLVDKNDFKVQIAGDIHDWDPTKYIEAREVKRIDRFSEFAIVACIEAVAQSGIDFSKEDPTRCGVILGSGIGGLGTIEAQMIRLMSKGPDRVSPLTIPKIMLNAAGAQLSITYGVQGPNYTVATACASATNAMGDALNSIRSGATDVIITGGAEAAITRMGMAAFQNMRALSTRNDEPQRASRPFDVNRDGFVFSEGAGILIFEELEHAKRRGAPILAEVLGAGHCSDASHISAPDTTGAGAARTMSVAAENAEINPEDVDYVNAHGTSTGLGDKAETVAIKRVFGDHANSMSISSTKSHLGHSLGASGGIELVLTTKAVMENIVPPTINLDDPDPECDLDYTANEPKQREINVAMSNSFGFGGHNASIVIGKLRDK
jgi:3-oxoacyl-[acyl-carrier-protein] synthase II